MLYDIPVVTIDGRTTTLAEYKGLALLVVNTASKCGLTPQYEGLNALYKKYKERGLVVLGFPCNQFLKQEPWDEKKIAEFCEEKYQIEFPMFGKVLVNGRDAHPLFKLLKKEAPGFLGIQRIRWNFNKFLVSRDGTIVRRFEPTKKPGQIEAEVLRALG